MKRLIALLFAIGILGFVLTFVWVTLQTQTIGGPDPGPRQVRIEPYIVMAAFACIILAVVLAMIHMWRSKPSVLGILLLFPIGLGLLMIGTAPYGASPVPIALAGVVILVFAVLLALRSAIARLRPTAGSSSSRSA